MSEQKMTTFEMEAEAFLIGNSAWTRLQDLMDDKLGNREDIDPESVREAEIWLQFKKAISLRADFISIRLRYEAPKTEVL